MAAEADVDNARHPRDAVTSGKTNTRKPRVATATPGRQIERGGR
jgi:hypothetical protein